MRPRLKTPTTLGWCWTQPLCTLLIAAMTSSKRYYFTVQFLGHDLCINVLHTSDPIRVEFCTQLDVRPNVNAAGSLRWTDVPTCTSQ